MNTNLHKLTLALTVPALAGLMAVSGCDDKSDTKPVVAPSGTNTTPMNDTATGMKKDVGDMTDKGPNDVKGMMGNDSQALAGVPQAAIDKLTQMSQDAAEMAEKYKDQAKDMEVPGYGTGDAAVSKLGSINEAFDALKGGIEDRNFAEVTSSLTKLKGMNLTGDLKTKLMGIVDAMKSANVPGIDKLMPGM